MALPLAPLRAAAAAAVSSSPTASRTRKAAPPLPPLSEEYAQASLGDVRRTRRLLRLVKRLGPRPAASFPKACRTAAELEGCYRLLGNDEVHWQDVLAPHVEASLRRAREAAAEGHALVAAHDTSLIRFLGSEEGAREGLGPLSHGETGFLLHLALLCSLPKAPQHALAARPLGVVGLVPHVREARQKGRSARQQQKETEARAPAARESARWGQLALEAQGRCTEGSVPHVVHVMDREADSLRLFWQLQAAGCAFVIRGRADRVLESAPAQQQQQDAETAQQEDETAAAAVQREGAPPKLYAALQQAPMLLTREVPLTERKGKWKGARGGQKAQKSPARKGRTAHLEVRALSGLVLKTGKYARKSDAAVPPSLTLNALEVLEPDPPEGEEAVRWVLWTSLPVTTAEEVAHALDCYRARWSVEELFKALKTGCALEQRQLMSLAALLNATALLLPMAWRLLALRGLAHSAPDTPASHVLEPDELALLRRLSLRVKLPPEPTCQQALYALAGLGGHLKHNGPPGWQTLGRGLETLLTALEGWRAAREQM